MSRKSETRQIGGFEVSTTKLRPTSALKLAPKLLKILVPLLRLQNAADILQHDAGRFVAALTDLLGTLDDATLDTLYRELLCDTSITVPNDAGVLSVIELNTAQMIDIAFGGQDNGLQLLVETMIFVGEVNFKRSFFDLAARLGLKRKAPATTADPA